MKMIRLFLVVAALVFVVSAVFGEEKKGVKTVVFNADLHCGSCKAKVEKNIPYEKGVKDLKVDMDKKTITVSFREDKNTTEGIRKAIEKLKIDVAGVVGEAPVCGKACADAKEKCNKECPQSEKKADCCKGEKK